VIEFIPTGKPVLYLVQDDPYPLNDDGVIIEKLYQANSPERIQEFIEMVARGEDAMKAERMQAIGEFIFGLDGGAGKRIVDEIKRAINADSP